MFALDRIAYFQNRRDEVPNQELAKALAEKKDKKGIREIAENLWHKNAQVQSDCLKVLYEIGYFEPALIAEYVGDFLRLIEHKNNRLVWGSMIALSTIAPIKAAEIFKQVKAIQQAMERGSVITVDNGVATLALIAAGDDARRRKLFPYLLDHLKKCRAKEVPQHSEKTLPTVTAANAPKFVTVLQERMPELTASQTARVRRVIKQAQER